MTEQLPIGKYRHEYKYICNKAQNVVLKARAAGIMKVDRHAVTTGCYRVRSLYFDSLQDSCYYENEAGIGVREKYRIRMYDGDSSYIVLEKKSKNRQMCLKQGCRIDEAVCRQLMNGSMVRLKPDMPEALRCLLGEMQRKCMRPAVIVEYLRFPFVEQNGNVRVTFDENICSSNDIKRFLEPEIAVRPILQMGMGILEMKWDEFFPDYIKQHMQMDTLQWCSFSKYHLCRKYNMYGGIRI